ncbi:ATP-binding cassette domain-containing protein [Geodermatophilus sp. SYSU D00965]
MTGATTLTALLFAAALEAGYAGSPVCAPVDVCLQPGRALGLVGANGAGKSTLLQTLVGLLEPLAGTVAFAGREVDERRADFRLCAGALAAVAHRRSRTG